jgi:hypothetical protein
MNLTTRLRAIRPEMAATAIPMTIAVALLCLFTVPNYVQAMRFEREADVCRAKVSEAAARQDGLRAMQSDVERLRFELKRRGRSLPASPDQGELLAALGRSGERKGILSNEAKSGRMAAVAVPGVAGGKASRRSVDAQMSGSFDALFGTLAQAEGLHALVAVRSVEFTRSPVAGDAESPIEARFTFDEYFAERAAASAKEGD